MGLWSGRVAATQKTSFHSPVNSEGKGLGSDPRADKSEVQSCVEEGGPVWRLRSPAPPTPSGVHASPPAPSTAAGPQLVCPPRQWAGGPGFPGRDGTGAWLPALTSSGSVLRELQEREKALRLQKERLQRELEEKRRKVRGAGRVAPTGSALSSGLGRPGPGGLGRSCWGWRRGGARTPLVRDSLPPASPDPRKSSSGWLSSGYRRSRRRRPGRPRLPPKA